MVKKSVKATKKEMGWKHCCGMGDSGCGGMIYPLGFLGALIYYISTATGFWMGVLGVLKAIIWPLFIVMKILGM